MTSAVDKADGQIAKILRARQQTLDAIERKLAEVAALRTTYAHQGDRLDDLLEERNRAAIADALVTLTTAPQPGVCMCTRTPEATCPVHPSDPTSP